MYIIIEYNHIILVLLVYHVVLPVWYTVPNHKWSVETFLFQIQFRLEQILWSGSLPRRLFLKIFSSSSSFATLLDYSPSDEQRRPQIDGHAKCLDLIDVSLWKLWSALRYAISFTIFVLVLLLLLLLLLPPLLIIRCVAPQTPLPFVL